MEFSENLKKIRKQRNMSQEDLASCLNVSRQAVSRWESGTYYPETEKLFQLAKLLEVSLDTLVYGESVDERKETQSFTGRILIRSYDGKSIVNCYKVKSNQVMFKTKKKSPRFALFGVDSSSLFGDNTTLLGMYLIEEDVQKEIKQIEEAMQKGISHYELQYAADVKISWFSLRLKDD